MYVIEYSKKISRHSPDLYSKMKPLLSGVCSIQQTKQTLLSTSMRSQLTEGLATPCLLFLKYIIVLVPLYITTQRNLYRPWRVSRGGNIHHGSTQNMKRLQNSYRKIIDQHRVLRLYHSQLQISCLVGWGIASAQRPKVLLHTITHTRQRLH